MDQIKLLPCPWCGKEVVVRRYPTGYVIGHKDIGCKIFTVTMGHADIEELITEWNKRLNQGETNET